MFAPILPRPIIPSCIVCAPQREVKSGCRVPTKTCGSNDPPLQRLGDRFCERGQPGLYVLAEMYTQGAATALGEHSKVSACLCGLYHSEGVFLARHLLVLGSGAGDWQKAAAVRAALVRLAGRVKETRAETEAGGDFLFVADLVADVLQRLFVGSVHQDVAEYGEIVARLDAG